MADTHLQVNPDGTTTSRKTVLWPSSKNEQEQILRSIFERDNWKVTSIDNQSGSFWKITTECGVESYRIKLFISSIRDESRKSDEFKMQLGTSYPNGEDVGWITLVMGIYTIDDGTNPQQYILSGYDWHRYDFSGNPSIRGTRTAGLQKAKMFGMFKTDQSILFRPEFIYYYINYSNYLFGVEKTQDIPQDTEETKKSYQQIFYGAPGTGKSNKIKKLTDGHSVIRTTFHPDSDYSTFVGCYKPTMSEEETRVVPVVVTSGISLDQNNGTYKENRITYKFVMQAFLKAYLGAWKKFADADSDTNPAIPSTLHFYASGAHYTITGIDADGITYNKKFQYPLTVNKIATAWNEIWKSGAFVMPSGRIPGRSLEQAVSQWIKDNIEDCTKDSLEEGLDAFKEEIAKTWVVVVSKGTQKYSFYANGDNEIFPVSADATSKRTTLKEYYSGEKDIEDATEIKRKLVEKLAEYDADSFDNAWDKMTEAVKGNHDALLNTDTTPAPQFLIIEEINRGNCAQIFGDLFQLLDRSDNGFSEYPIEADTDLQQVIERAFKEEDEYKLINNIDVESAIDDYTSNYDSTLSDDIQNGRVLLLPPNLYIWATMNTSDQSLFPIDSAFKRRWDWVYIPIDTHKEDWYIKVNNIEYSWPSFLDKINDEVLSDETAEDKHLGFYFCKAEGNIISVEKFVSKVLFYLWNDVFKVYGVPEMLTKGDKNITFHKFYNTDGTINETLVAKLLDNIGVEKKVKEHTTESTSDETVSATE